MLINPTFTGMAEFATSGDKDAPDAALLASGYLPQELLPAQQFNWLMNRASKGVTETELYVDNINKELNAVLVNLNTTPNDGEHQISDKISSAATADTLMKRDASGRAKVAAPSADDDIARKQDADSLRNALSQMKYNEVIREGFDFTLPYSGTTTYGICAMSSGLVACFVKTALIQVARVYVYSETDETFSQFGSDLSIPLQQAPVLTRMGTDSYAMCAVYSAGVTYLWMLSWNGSVFSIVGSPLSISSTTLASITSLNTTDVAFVDSQAKTLKTYRFNGSTWSQLGSALTLSAMTSTTIPSVTTFSSTDIAIAYPITGSGTLARYTFNGSAWSLVGSSIALTASSTYCVTTLDSENIALANATASTIVRYKWNGSTWVLRRGSLSQAVQQIASTYGVSASPSRMFLTTTTILGSAVVVSPIYGILP